MAQTPAPGGAGVAATGQDLTRRVESEVHEKIQRHGGESTESTDKGFFDEMKEQERDEITYLARQISQISRRSSLSSGEPMNSFLDTTTDPELDPNSESFNQKKWVKNLLHITSRDPETYPRRTAGVTFRNLNAYGFGTAADYQADVFNTWLKAFGYIRGRLGLRKKRRIDILRDFEGLVKSGEMLVVLGRPGSGCSTLLRTLCGDTHGLWLDQGTDIQYEGVSYEEMHSRFRGEVIYQGEQEIHFPQMTAGDTLLFAARARAPANRLPGVSREQYAMHMRDVVMAILGLSHTKNTRVGNEYIRGVSGGERKRVSIAETTLCGSPLQCWDNSTRGLDSATALEFVRTLRTSTKYSGSTAIVAIYQAGQAIYDIFDKTIVLYEGRQIYFGRADDAKRFFIDMGFHCPPRQTTADFLTSLTSPAEREVRPGFEGRVPNTPDEFAARWRESPERQAFIAEMDAFQAAHPLGGEKYKEFTESRKKEKAKGTRAASPYTLTYPMQVKLCFWRGAKRLQGDMSNTLAAVIGNIIMSLIVSSMFYNLPQDTNSFYQRSSLMFFAILMNAFASVLEIQTLWDQRPIVEKHKKYALYHPSAEGLSSMLVDLPAKIVSAVVFNLILYFMTGLRRTHGAFFTFFLFSFTTTLTMSNLFRLIGSLSRTQAQAMVPAGIFMLALMIYTGFTIPIRSMHPWFRWINYINPIAYGFESLMVNEFGNRNWTCSNFVPSGPSYNNLPDQSYICQANGAVPGQTVVQGNDYLATTYQYSQGHLWRNFGILAGFFFFLLVLLIIASELVTAKPSKGEILVFPRGKIPSFAKNRGKKDDAEAPVENTKTSVEKNGHDEVAAIARQTSIFHWQDVCYDIKIKGEPRRILDNVDGWVKPGTLTALMGVTGAGKTSLLDVLANRVTIGVVTGQMLVDGCPRDSSFQRKTGYVQQQDLHLETSTVREALRFSALLRQPASVPKEEKYAYVEEVIKMLGMDEYAEAVVGVLGEGLNVEQRKRLTIGVEIAAKPDLLLFFDEPTSGLDSQTAWSICQLMRKLANHGQAILCTIHQPSAILMQEFDRLLFLAKGGRTIYFGDLGDSMSELISYFERNGSSKCPESANPAEWMLEVIGAAPGSKADKDWAEVWKGSSERAVVREKLAIMKADLQAKERPENGAGWSEFAMPLWYQFLVIVHRNFQQFWRTPGYIYAKMTMSVVPTLFIGFSFWRAGTSIQGLENQTFAIFMFLTMFPNLSQQMMPYFALQRSLYEVRERPSKAYSWIAFILASIVVEIPWNLFMAIPAFFAWYYPIGLYKNAEPTDSVVSRGGTMFLIILLFMLFTSTFTMMVVAGIDDAATAGQISQLMFSLCLVFCGVLVTPGALPGFWIFMYRVSPFTYIVSAVLSVGLAQTSVECSSIELLTLSPPNAGETCQSFLSNYILDVGGRIINPNATENCQFCSLATTDEFLAAESIYFSERWRDIGILFAYCGFNVLAAIFLYWLARVPRGNRVKEVPGENGKDLVVVRTRSRREVKEVK
ncbi:ABC multidrug transporter, putative [Talaromyces stipitatus ATCC 10500]|uniref:ABC multidrug transporter, putative n=1 Tax=Talaromyces stipitatus (strain ATCC 10500 / CBS 375.48 / QM 6759 / NRRL 1006) TaxID=441959 RepID=B8MQA0_TALSN|nr:ABC multidrug transporter, putative [Talaromyces stipitatus ATCC 10500]EED13247.1 ABC multidrug transporter, putative [Talaromyces stipitatus ATCC 10500]